MPLSRALPSTTASMVTHDRPSRRDDFQIAIICALPLEYDAASLLVDHFWDQDGKQYGRAPGDTNTYRNGRIGKYDVVLMLLPNIGKAAVAGSAASLRTSYPSLKLAFLVGICGGVPSSGAGEALLGDVVIGEAIIQHDFGRQYPGRFVPKETVEGNLGGPTKDIRSLIAYLRTEPGKKDLRQNAAKHLKALQDTAVNRHYQCNYRYPGFAEDKLFAATYRHKHRGPRSCGFCNGKTEDFCDMAARATCAELHCDESQLVPRKRLEWKRDLKPEDAQCPEIFIGRIASGDTVMKSGEHRDQIAKQQSVIAFEMEGAGAWDEIPCIAVKGICDYADSHKHKAWQPFAAATAAAVMRAVLERYTLTDNPESATRSTGKRFQPSGLEFPC
ncbi:nucleoside phosphorylase domain-containing protein [Diplogelasinospora grovesii]|uniref:Nucleoside phosphorylase domain-containing protein n=1 Tax=Diplogelasinospora grovesii TaxID=303347 RepID=A0AAN6RZK0_9PEZI|nr:nucleoside phosphorylase domain-containing protein [Diplogelasinospora grovesii]